MYVCICIAYTNNVHTYYTLLLHCRNTVDSLQKVMDQMEQDQAMLGKKVHRLQESLKSYKKVW